MKVYLYKKNKKTIDVVAFEKDEGIVRISEGKFKSPPSFTSSRNLGTGEKAEEFIKEQIKEYESKGFSLSDEFSLIKLETFDKAKWHYGAENFPKELDVFQGYVHTGVFIGWLIEMDLVNEDFKKEYSSEIELLRTQQKTATQFYHDALDGVFSNDVISLSAIPFVEKYFNFKTGQYLIDYENTLGEKLPTLYHVKDSWSNYDKIKVTISNRFTEFKSNKSL